MSIADVLRAFKKHWVTEIILFCVAIGVTAGITSAMPTMYTAQSEVLVQASPVSDDLASAQQAMSASAQVAVASMCPDIVKFDAVLKPVIDNLGLHATVSDLRSKIDAVTSDASTVIQLTATYSDSEDSAKIVDELTSQLEKQLQKIYTSLRVSLSVVQKPVVPSAPSSPNVIANYGIGIAVGIVLALIGAVIREMSDKSLNEAADVQAITSTPILAAVPKSHTVADGTPAVIVKPRGRAAEEIRRLGTNLSFVTPSDLNQPNVIIVTSSNPREGKTTISVNLAVALAEKGKSVLLIDADVRHPSVAKTIGMNSGVGLVSLLAGEISAKEAIQPYWKPYLHVLPSENQKESSGIILGSDAMRTLINQAAERYDYVIVDTAPMTVANDAAVFAKHGGVLVMVVGQGVAQKKAVHETFKEFNMSHTSVRGIVLNMASSDNAKRSGYYYYEDASDQKNHNSSGKSHSRKKHNR